MSAGIEITAHFEGRFIASFAFQHMKAALLFKTQVVQAETTHAGEPFGPFIDDILIHGSACYMSSAAALEALVNELFMMEGGPLHSNKSDFDTKKKDGTRWPLTLKKYQTALDILGAERIPEDADCFKDAWALFSLRNALVHFKPPWDPVPNEHLERQLSGRFATSPFVDQGADFVALKCMSAGGVTWAENTVFAFVQEFHERTRIFPKKIQQFLSLRQESQRGQ